MDHFAQTWWIHGDIEHHSYRKAEREVKRDSITEKVQTEEVNENGGACAALPTLMVKMGPDLSLSDDEAKNLTKEQQNQVEELLSEYEDIFGEPSGHAKVEAQIIEVEPGARPSLQRSYSVSPAKLKIMDEKLDHLLEKGYIEPCTSEWAAPSLLVAKGDTGME